MNCAADAVVNGDGGFHARADLDLAVHDHGRFLGGANGEDGSLRRVDDGDEFFHVVHAEVEGGEGRAATIRSSGFVASRQFIHAS